MEEILGKLKKVAISFLKKISIPLIGVCGILVLLSAILYFITIDEGSYQKGKKSNTPYASEQHSSDVNIDENGNMSTNMTVQELWDKMLEDGSNVDDYLSGPEELNKLIHAQMVTDYIDTRENVDEEINWDEIINDVDSKRVQGVVKLKRAKSDGNIVQLKYKDPETFQSYMDEYKNTGSDQAKENALTSFTIEKKYVVSNADYKIGTDGEAILIDPDDATLVTDIPQGNNYGSRYSYCPWQVINVKSSQQYKLREQAGMTFDEEGFGRINGRYVVAMTRTFGKVGDYIDYYYKDEAGNEHVIPCILGDITFTGDPGYTEWGILEGTNMMEFYVNEITWTTPDWYSGKEKHENIRSSK